MVAPDPHVPYALSPYLRLLCEYYNMGCDVLVDIDKHENGGTFTNYDIISGNVRLLTTSLISLAYIQVKLEGVATSSMLIPRNPEKRERDKHLQDVHQVLYDTLVVFPPENVRLVSASKEYTLVPGTYEYPFQFKIPLASQCIKKKGITNKVQFNSQNFRVMVNNGNFNRGVLKNAVSKAVLSYMAPPGQQGQQMPRHVERQLPPLMTVRDLASVRYYIKVTCKRSSFLKSNLRAYDPFVFLPLDIDKHNRPLGESLDFDEYKEEFYRREIVFRNRLPEIVGLKLDRPPPLDKKGFFFLDRASGFDIKPTSVPFSFEVRFRHPAFLVPAYRPSFRLYLLLFQDPFRYSLGAYGKPEESNGLGVVYMQKLIIELRCSTTVLVIETDGSLEDVHQARKEDVVTLCNNTYENLRFDFHSAKKLLSLQAVLSEFVQGDSYELEIPRRYFDNLDLPSNLPPLFETCNILRKYSLSVVGGFSSDKITDFKDKAQWDRKVRYAELGCPEIRILSGLKMTSWLHSNASGLSLRRELAPPVPEKPKPPFQNGNSSQESVESPGRLPTYDDVVLESSYQDVTEHQRARRRYQQ